MYHLQTKIFNIYKSLFENVSVRGEGRRRKVHVSSVKGSIQQSGTSGSKVNGGGPLFSGRGPLITRGLVNDTTPGCHSCHICQYFINNVCIMNL